MEILPIATFRSPFGSKFGVPRQSGIVGDLPGRIVMSPEWGGDALTGMDTFDYLWLIWGFSENVNAKKHPTVRPPRLGGNEHRGVFATRSSFRPNNLALSSVRLIRIERNTPEGTVIHVKGADLMDGTPIYDIKPYLPFTDSHPEAKAGFIEEVEWHTLKVEISEELKTSLSPEELYLLTKTLEQDPRPPYHHDEKRIYGMTFGQWDVKFSVENGVLYVNALQKSAPRPTFS